MLSTNNTRRQITDLSEPVQVRELNRQLEWIWQQLLGGLNMRNLSKNGVQQVTELITDTTAAIYDPQIEEIEGDIDDIEDILAVRVSGVKGDAETDYRTGNINLTPANIGSKATQNAVSDPSASGTSVTFIDSISQNAQGVISPTKKTVATASQSADGLMSSADKAKLDGIASGAQVNSVTGVKGNAESSYRTGNINLTPGNIGAISTSDIANNLTTTAAGKVLDARMGKALKDDVDTVAGHVTALEGALVYPKSVS